MSLPATDQAESLRRMLAPRVTRRIAVVSAERGAGGSTVALGLAHALARQGERVLLIEEDGQGRAVALSGAQPRATLADVLAGRVPLDAALGDLPADAAAVLPAGRIGADDARRADALADVRTVLVDTQPAADGALSPFAQTAHNLLVVMRAERLSLPATYASIKRLHHLYACRRFQLLVNLAATEAEVGTLTHNLSQTCSDYLGVQLNLAGYLPADPLVARSARLGRGVVDAFPAAPATAALRRTAAGIGAWPLPTPASHASPVAEAGA